MAPDPVLLEEAQERLVVMLKVPPRRQLRWEVGRRVDRPRSTGFELQLHVGDVRVAGAYYKCTLVSPSAGLIERRRAQTRASQQMKAARLYLPTLSEALRPLGVTVPLVLAGDPTTLTEISTLIPGRPLGTAVRQFLGPRSRGAAAGHYRLVGRALRALQDHCRVDALLAEADGLSRNRGFHRMSGLVSADEYAAISECLDGLRRQAVRGGGGVSLAHGDVSETNVLRHKSGIGLVDFGWAPELPHYDLAVFVARLETELPGGPWAKEAVASVFDGYATPGVEAHPAFQYTRTHRLCKVVRRRKHRLTNRYTAARALHLVREQVRAATAG